MKSFNVCGIAGAINYFCWKRWIVFYRFRWLIIFLRSILAVLRAALGCRISPPHHHEHDSNEIYSVFVSVVDNVIIRLVIVFLFFIIIILFFAVNNTTEKRNYSKNTHTTRRTYVGVWRSGTITVALFIEKPLFWPFDSFGLLPVGCDGVVWGPGCWIFVVRPIGWPRTKPDVAQHITHANRPVCLHWRVYLINIAAYVHAVTIIQSCESFIRSKKTIDSPISYLCDQHRPYPVARHGVRSPGPLPLFVYALVTSCIRSGSVVRYFHHTTKVAMSRRFLSALPSINRHISCIRVGEKRGVNIKRA